MEISEKTYLYIAGCMLESELVKSNIITSASSGHLYITNLGLNRLDQIIKSQLPIHNSSNTDLNHSSSDYEYDIAISFAGEDRNIDKMLAHELNVVDVKVFFEEFKVADLWGRNMYTYFRDVYSKKSRYCLIILSKSYKEKAWTNHELDTINYIDYNSTTLETIIELIVSKLEK